MLMGWSVPLYSNSLVLTSSSEQNTNVSAMPYLPRASDDLALLFSSN